MDQDFLDRQFVSRVHGGGFFFSLILDKIQYFLDKQYSNKINWSRLLGQTVYQARTWDKIQGGGFFVFQFLTKLNISWTFLYCIGAMSLYCLLIKQYQAGIFVL